MSSKEYTVTRDEARRLAVQRARSSYGTFIRVGDSEFDKDNLVYRFPLHIRRPRVIHDADDEKAIDVAFHPKLELGTIEVGANNKEIEAPHREHLYKKIREHQESIEIAIRKALISTSAEQFAHLPFLENQFAPLEDILSELLLNGSIPRDLLLERDDDRDNPSYESLVEDLEEIRLATHRRGKVRRGDLLIQIYNDHGEKYHKALNEAMGVYFKNNLDQFERIFQVLGPYLVIAGRYYKRAIEKGEVPTIHEEELRDAIKAEYNGKRRRRSLFKFSHYLIKLQEVGILKPSIEEGTRYWEGTQSVADEIEGMASEFDQIQELLSVYS